MDTQDLIRNLETEYYASMMNSPNWNELPLLFDYLTMRGVAADDIWEYSAQIGHSAGKPEPEWLAGRAILSLL